MVRLAGLAAGHTPTSLGVQQRRRGPFSHCGSLRGSSMPADASTKERPAARQKISFGEVRKGLIERTAKAVGNNARFVEAGLEIKRRDGTPNWVANIGIAPTTVSKAFDEALTTMQNQYNIEW